MRQAFKGLAFPYLNKPDGAGTGKKKRNNNGQGMDDVHTVFEENGMPGISNLKVQKHHEDQRKPEVNNKNLYWTIRKCSARTNNWFVCEKTLNNAAESALNTNKPSDAARKGIGTDHLETFAGNKGFYALSH